MEQIIYYLAVQPDGAAEMVDMRKQLELGQSSTSRLCDALQAAGFVTSAPSPKNRRATRITLTAKAHRLIDKTISAIRSRHR